MIPLLVAIAIIFVPLGAAMWYASDRIQDITIEYTQCEEMALNNTFTPIPDNYTSYNFKRDYTGYKPNFSWRIVTDDTQPYEEDRKVCQIQFQVLTDIKGPLYLYYRLHKFHANHRRYVKSFSEDQLNGKAASLDTIKNTVGQNCEPLSQRDGKRFIHVVLLPIVCSMILFQLRLKQLMVQVLIKRCSLPKRVSIGQLTKIDSKRPNIVILR